MHVTTIFFFLKKKGGALFKREQWGICGRVWGKKRKRAMIYYNIKNKWKEFKTRTPNQQQLWPPPCISDPDLDLQPSQYPSVTSVAGIDDAYNTANCTVSQPLAECLASAWWRKGKGWRKAREQFSERWSREGGLVGSCSNQGGLLQRKLSENGMSTSAAELQPCLQRYPLMKGPSQMKGNAPLFYFLWEVIIGFKRLISLSALFFSLPVTPSWKGKIFALAV